MYLCVCVSERVHEYMPSESVIGPVIHSCLQIKYNCLYVNKSVVYNWCRSPVPFGGSGYPKISSRYFVSLSLSSHGL